MKLCGLCGGWCSPSAVEGKKKCNDVLLVRSSLVEVRFGLGGDERRGMWIGCGQIYFQSCTVGCMGDGGGLWVKFG